MRVGLGVDAHALVEGVPLVLGGVEVDSPRGLAGHSDGDVVAHALIDAVLGAAGLGDIGSLFPSGAAEWEGASSLDLLSRAYAQVREAGFELANADCVLVGEEPRIAPLREAMRAKLAEAMGVDLGRVNVRATTTDKLRLHRPGRRARRARGRIARMKIVQVDPEIRRSDAFRQVLRRAWPEIVMHDEISNANWGRLYEERPEFQFALVDEGRMLAEGNSIPVAGMPAAWRDALRDGFDADEPDRLCAIAILIDPDVQQRGLSRTMLEHMRGLAHARGWELVAPVRPTLKHRYPLTPIERYVEWRREDGLLFDPWLRAHERLGAELVGIAPDSLVSEGTVAELEEWCGLEFPESGSYVVEGALVPIEIDRERDRGVYREPNVWMRHPAPAKADELVARERRDGFRVAGIDTREQCS